MKKTTKLALMVTIALATIVGGIYAEVHYSGTFRNDDIKLGGGNDWLHMQTGNDRIYTAIGTDEINLGPDSDILHFFAYDLADVETIAFSITPGETMDATKMQFDNPKSYIQYRHNTTDIEIVSERGDVIITLGS